MIFAVLNVVFEKLPLDKHHLPTPPGANNHFECLKFHQHINSAWLVYVPNHRNNPFFSMRTVAMFSKKKVREVGRGNKDSSQVQSEKRMAQFLSQPS